MVVREKISGALYADALLGEEELFDPDALGMLTFLAGLVVDRLAARKLKPAPALRVPEAFKKPEPAGMWIGDEARGGRAGGGEPESIDVESASEPAPAPQPPRAAPHFRERPPHRTRRAPRDAGHRSRRRRSRRPSRRARPLGGPLALRPGRRAAGGSAALRAAARLGDQALQRAGRSRGARGRQPLPAPAGRHRPQPSDVRRAHSRGRPLLDQLLPRGARADPRRWPSRSPRLLTAWTRPGLASR